MFNGYVSSAESEVDEEIRRLSFIEFKRQIRSKEYEAARSRVAECTFKGYMSNTESVANEVIRRLSFVEWLSYEGRTVNALALGADEGRDEHRNASGSCK